jgi:hypothetical protein
MENSQKGFIAIILGIVVVCAIAIGGFLYWQTNRFTTTPQGDSSQSTESSESPQQPEQTSPENSTPDPNSIFIPPPMTGSWVPGENPISVQWRKDAIPMADLKLVAYFSDSYSGSQTAPSVNYYDMGANGDNKIILATIDPVTLGGPTIFFFEQIPGGYRFMEKSSTREAYNSETKSGYALSSKVLSADTTTFYADITGPTDFTYKGLKLEQPYLYPSDLYVNYIKQYTNPLTGYAITKADTTPYGDLYLRQMTYKTQNNITSQLYLNSYILKLPSGLYTIYNITYDFFSNNSVPNITWNNGIKNQDSYHQDAHLGGCGNPGSSVTFARDISDISQQIGVTSTNKPIYELKDFNDPIIKFFYGLYGGSYNSATGQFDKISIESWYTYHPVIFYKNPLNEYVVFTNDKYGLQAECGKPVIYLYPAQTTNVKVYVGADITKSEPLYNNGWQIKASPDGTLIAPDGSKYDSLFWEGTGHGDYPNITEGFVVPQSQLETTIKSQLKELGLSDRESNDFLTFWLLKMPNTPYVRLTWFTEEQLNKLAPLIILPKPDTIIRIFLDFQGLQNNISLPTQHLTTLQRKGFTVIEWGGLLQK